jgi:DNA-binding HxlR family transcriptional regulator
MISFTEINIMIEIYFCQGYKWRNVWYNMPMRKISQSFTNHDARQCEEQSASMSRAMNLIGDMWTLMIVFNLLGGPRRFGELLDAMGSVSPKTVSQRLKMLEEIGCVERRAFAEIPPRVEYRLTEKGLALVDVIEAIKQFGERHLSDDQIASSTSPTLDNCQPCHE